MKCVSLANVGEYCTSLSEKSYQVFKLNEVEYGKMWSSQGLEFWVKFVVSLRQSIVNSSSKYDEKCEKELIIFLKALSFKNFTEVINYLKFAYKTIKERLVKYKEIQDNQIDRDPLRISNMNASEVESYSLLRALTIKLKCAGAFVNLLTAWKCASVGDDFQFSPPESWTIPSTTAEPLEAFIRAKWSGFRNIEAILGCKKEDIAWWTSPARKVDQSKLQPQPSSVSNGNHAPPKNNSHRGKKSQPQNSMSHSKKRNTRTRKKSEGKCSWLPSKATWKLFEFDIIEAKKLEKRFELNPVSKLKVLLNNSFFTLLKRKYHCMDTEALSRGDPDSFGVAPWFVMVCEAFGTPYLRYILDCHEDVKLRCQQSDAREMLSLVDDWSTCRTNDRKVLENVIDKIGAPDEEKDSIESAAEFLLEPCVLIQLPWQPVMLRQWLAAALIEIFKFELESMEFRHWPLSLDVEPIVRELLALVTEAKERILLGWYAMSYDVSMSPIDDTKRHSLILDQVILPSINTLEFLCSGKAQNILIDLKKLSWFKNQSLKNKVNSSQNTCMMNEKLVQYFFNFFGHFMFWDDGTNRNTEPFPTVFDKDDSKLYSITRELQIAKTPILPTPNKPFHIVSHSSEEGIIYDFVKLKANESSDPSISHDRIEKSIKVIKEVVIKCGHFSPEKSRQLLNMVSTADASLVFMNNNKPPCTGPVKQLILSCAALYEISQIIQFHKEDAGIICCLNYLTAKVMEREQLVRVLAACSLLLKESPSVCQANNDKCPLQCSVDKKKPPMALSAMKQLICEVQEKKLNQDRKELWSRFPEEWQKDVDSGVPMPTMEDGIPAIITALEARVGRIVWNATQDNFVVHARGGEVYPHAQVVQYLVPSYISTLIQAAKFPSSKRNLAKQQNLIKLLCGLIEHYENSYHTWLINLCTTLRKPIYNEVDNDMRIETSVSPYLVERISCAIHSFAGLGRIGEDTDVMSHFGVAVQGLLDYLMFNSIVYTSKIELLNCDAWVHTGYPHFHALHEACFVSMPVPTPDSLLYCHELQDFYLASALIHQLEIHYSQTDWFCLQFAGHESDEHKVMKELMIPLRNWRYELFRIVFETEGKFNHPKNMLSIFIEGKGKQMLEKMFNMFKIVHQQCVSTPVHIEFPAWGTVELQRHFELFLSGELQSLKLFEARAAVQEPPAKVLQLPGTLVSCNNCHRTETKHGSFQRCPVCLENGYPFPNFFCSQRCQEAWWKTEHMAEHLEFDLGLCDFRNLSDAGEVT